MKRLGLAFMLCSMSAVVAAEVLTLEQAIERALNSDPRIEEREHLVDAARALEKQVSAHQGWFLEGNSFIALTTTADGGFFSEGSCAANDCKVSDDRYNINGLSPWFYLQVGLIKPLYTFGKIENYSAAAKANTRIKGHDVSLQRGNTVLDVKRAYYGYLAARDGRLLLTDVIKRLQSATDLVQQWLDSGEGDVSLSDLYALQAGMAMVAKYQAQSQALERVALDGLKVVTGLGLAAELSVTARRLRPLPLPDYSLTVLQQQALKQRPEMAQLEAGLQARRALVEASKAEAKPNVYAGLMGGVSYAPGRESLESPYVYDPFHEAALTPVLGIKWSWAGKVVDAKTEVAEAELNALISTSSLARAGIPYQVAEQYHNMVGNAEAVAQLELASRSARRWMIASYTDFEAGLEKADKVMAAFQAYVLASADYLQTTYQYNMHVAQLEQVTGVAQ